MPLKINSAHSNTVVTRSFWEQRIHEIWKTVPIVWLAGVRRSGKTTLSESLLDSTLINCDLPSTRSLLKDPETFYKQIKTKIIIFDEIHQLKNPSEVLKIGADLYRNKFKILATGSSTIAATEKFKDTLTGRKRSIHLVPVLPEECADFGISNLKTRLLHGGLPPALLSEKIDSGFYSEWIDSFYARDVQELFRIEKRQAFIELLELLLRQNGGLAEVTNLAKLTGLSRPSTVHYLEALETTQAITVLRPFHGGGKQELTSQPKIYGFDTGFIAFAKGWDELRSEDCGLLLENLVLESLQAIPELKKVHYWRTKQQQEVDFVVPVGRSSVHAIECKWKGAQFDSKALRKFREDYPDGENFLVCSDAHLNHQTTQSRFPLQIVSIEKFREVFQTSLKPRN